MTGHLHSGQPGTRGEPGEPGAAQVVTELYERHALALVRLAYIMLGDRHAARHGRGGEPAAAPAARGDRAPLLRRPVRAGDSTGNGSEPGHRQVHHGQGISRAGASHGTWWSRTGVSFCGVPVLARVHGHVLRLGDCAGLLGSPGQKITLRVGQQIDVHMVEESGSRSGKKLVPLYPLPRTSRRSVVVRTWTSADRASATYRAIHPGRAVLASQARCFDAGLKDHGTCPVLVVTVVP
jgi:hypothetical protein